MAIKIIDYFQDLNSYFPQELLRKSKAFIVDITTEVGPEDDHSLTNTKYFVYKVMDSASTKFRKSIKASFMVQMPAFVSIISFQKVTFFLYTQSI